MKQLFICMFLILASVGCGKRVEYVSGPKGEKGDVGETGAQGIAGANGLGCTITSVAPNVSAPNGGSLITCANSSSLVLNGTNGTNGSDGADGANGQDGSDGQDGVDGQDGTNGTNGQNGSPGTVITSVQLCPGTTVYPSKFIEVAFCMDNQLYGVYSANGGFMTLLPPGTYGSNGINASCNFVIQPNCVIQN